MTTTARPTGALPTPPEILENAWPIGWALARAPLPVPAKFHSPLCQNVTIDQNGYGACVTYSGSYVQAALEVADEGRELLPDVLDPLRLYATLKGYSWPPRGTNWDSSPGLYAQQLWSYTTKIGWPTKDGSAARRDASYFNLGRPSSSAAFRDAYQQTLLQLGPIQFIMGWPNNWWNTDSAGYMPTPGPAEGAHAFMGCGWGTVDGNLVPICHQSWGAWGHDPEYPNHFRIKPAWLDTLGMEAWKVTDVLEGNMITFTPIGTATIDNIASTRGIRPDGLSLVPVPLGQTVPVYGRTTLTGPHPGPAFLIIVGGTVIALLERNTTANTVPPVGSHSVELLADGAPIFTGTI